LLEEIARNGNDLLRARAQFARGAGSQPGFADSSPSARSAVNEVVARAGLSLLDKLTVLA
jgi:hypothetical protein